MSDDAMPTNPTRRALIKSASATLAALPLLFVARSSWARTDPAGRTRLQYQSMPKDTMNCSSCLEFLPGADSQAPGGCKLLPGDDEISPQGYCTAWNTM